MSIQRQLTRWVWLNHTISQCSNWGKGADHVTIIRSLHSSRIEYHYVHSNTSIQRQLTYWVWGNHTISQRSKWRKRKINHRSHLYKCITLHRGQCTVKYHSEVTYHLREYGWISSVDQFTDCQCSKLVRKWKQASLDTHNKRLITYTYILSRLLTSQV